MDELKMSADDKASPVQDDVIPPEVLDDDFGCCYPGECCMPGLHLLSECHTAADIEAQHKETPND